MSKPTDLVISYVVNSANVIAATYEPLKKALDEGYRVVDVFTAPSDGAAGAGHGMAVVTVLLTSHAGTSAYCRIKPASR